VAVAVADGPEPDQVADVEAGLLEQLPAGRRFWPLAGLELATRELPEAGKEAGRRSTLDQPPTSVGEDDDRGPNVGPATTTPAHRQGSRVRELAIGPAGRRDRADGAQRTGRPADRLPELHHCLVEIARASPGQQGDQGRLEARADGRVANVPFLAGPAGRDPEAVRLERDVGATERDRRDGSGDVRTDAGKALEFGRGGGEAASSISDEPTSRLVQVMGPAVVAGPFPDLEDAADAGARERVDGGERFHEPLEVRGGLGDAGLLQQDLRDPDAVRVPVAPPWQRSTVEPIPPEQVGRQRGREGCRGQGGGTHGPVVPDERGA